MLAPATSPRRLGRFAVTLTGALAVIAVAVSFTPVPAGAAPSGASVRQSPGTSLNTGTCRPKWPYIVLTCVA